MPTKPKTSSDASNRSFATLINRLAELGMSQTEMANELGVSKAHFSRVKSGERQAAPKHLAKLRSLVREREKSLRAVDIKPPFFAVSNQLLATLTPGQAVVTFRDLLWTRATQLGIPRTKVTISLDINVADGGVDASVDDKLGPQEDLLLQPGTRYQVKTGEAAPWTDSWLRKELFGSSKAVTKNNLGAAVRQCLDKQSRYVLVCFGIDPPEDKIRAGKAILVELLAKCGYANASIDIWTQTHLTALLNQYPSLCLRLMGENGDGFKTHESWSQNSDMLGTFHPSPEQMVLLEEVQASLVTGDYGHLRLIGEPGIGKTRFALEATKGAGLSPSVLYYPDGDSFQRSPLVNELTRSDDSRFVVFVVDECRPKDRASIWNQLKSRGNRVRLITIDHTPDESADEQTRIIPFPASGKDQITQIICDHGVHRHDAARWAEFCEGCPRVAHVIGANLASPERNSNLLQEPGTVDVWNRFIEGRDAAAAEDTILRKIVLQHISLFERFGFKRPVEAEAQFIADMCSRCDARITWGRFQAIVSDLKRRRIVQGSTTLYITPRLLHIHCLKEFWNSYGGGFEVVDFLDKLPGELWNWFVGMLRYSHLSSAASESIERLLSPSGVFSTETLIHSEKHAKLIEVLVDADRLAVMRCMRRLIDSMTTEELLSLNEGRYYVVSALQKLAVWEEHFVDAAELLLRLAEAENSAISKNATETFCGLFSLMPGMAATRAAPAIRLRVLESSLASTSRRIRELGLSACMYALNAQQSFRMIGPEYQGLRPAIEFWAPKTYGELWSAYEQVWNLMIDKLTTWEGEERHELISAIIRASWMMLSIRRYRSSAVDVLESLATDSQTDRKLLLETIGRQERRRQGGLPKGLSVRLQKLEKRIAGRNFHSKLVRYIQHATWDDMYGPRPEGGLSLAERTIERLAKQASKSTSLLAPELPWLVRDKSSQCYSFARRLAVLDSRRATLKAVLDAQESAGNEAGMLFLSGYLAGIAQIDLDEWEAVMLNLSKKPFIARRFSDVVIASGMSHVVANRVIELCETGEQDSALLANWWFSGQLVGLPESVILKLIDVQLRATDPGWVSAMSMFHTYFIRDDRRLPLPAQYTFDLLVHHGKHDERRSMHEAGYCWSRVADALLNQDSSFKWPLFREILLGSMRRSYVASRLSEYEVATITNILISEPTEAWQIICEVYETNGDERLYPILHWLSGGHGYDFDDDVGETAPISAVPSELIFKWIDEDEDNRAYWIAMALPKTLNHTAPGRLTRNFIARYGTNEHATAGLNAHFHCRGWSGNGSDHFRKLRDDARGWLSGESNRNVAQWIGDYIDGLTSHIERFEIDEERRF